MIFVLVCVVTGRMPQSETATTDISVTRWPKFSQARSYVQARGGSCLLVPRRLN